MAYNETTKEVLARALARLTGVLPEPTLSALTKLVEEERLGEIEKLKAALHHSEQPLEKDTNGHP